MTILKLRIMKMTKARPCPPFELSQGQLSVHVPFFFFAPTTVIYICSIMPIYLIMKPIYLFIIPKHGGVCLFVTKIPPFSKNDPSK